MPSYDESVIRLNKDGVRWQMEADFAPTLERILRDVGETIKKSPAKLVTKHQLDGGTFYVKRYRNDSVALRPLKYLFRTSHGRREWELAVEIQKRGVPVVKHVAYGERWKGGGLQESLLITEAFDGLPLMEYPDRGLECVQHSLGRFVRDTHDKGVIQFDLAPNILVRHHPFELRRVDVHHAVIKDELGVEERLENVAFTNVLLPLSDAFFEGYGWDGALVARTRQRSKELGRAYWHRRSGRCFKRNAEFGPKRIGGMDWQVRKPFLSASLENILKDADKFLSTRAEILKPGRASTVGKAEGLVLKRYNFRVRKPANAAKDIFRSSKARQAFRKAYHLELAGIPTARPIATADVRRARILLRSYLVMEEIPGAVDLGKWRGDSREAALKVAGLLADLHNKGFMHRDLKETNVVFDGAGRVFLLDLEGLKFVDVVSEDRAAADLARLARAAQTLPRFSRNDWLAFIHTYCRLREIRPRRLGVL